MKNNIISPQEKNASSVFLSQPVDYFKKGKIDYRCICGHKDIEHNHTHKKGTHLFDCLKCDCDKYEDKD